MKKYESMLTTVGKAKLMAAQAKGEHVQLTIFAVGSGIQATVETQKALQKEEWRGTITNIAVDSKDKNVLDVETVIPANEGGFHIREFGVFDEVGDLIIVGNTPESYKPLLDAGAASSMRIISKTIISNAANVTLLMDENALYVTYEHLKETVIVWQQGVETKFDEFQLDQTRQDGQINLLMKGLQRLMIENELGGKVDGGYSFFDDFQGTPKAMQPLTQQLIIEKELPIGTTELNQGGTMFKVGEELTIFDDENHEDIQVLEMSSEKLTISTLKRNYKKGALLVMSTNNYDYIEANVKGEIL